MSWRRLSCGRDDRPTDRRPPAIARLERRARLTWAGADLTLVRTFGGGTWLQVLPFMQRGDGAREALTGRLGAIEPTAGRLYSYGLFPAKEATRIRRDPARFPQGFDYAAAVERRRLAAGDPTQPMAMAPGSLTVRMDAPCEYSLKLTLHDQGGDRVFDTPVYREREVAGSFAVPIDVPLWLTLHDVGGMAFERHGFGVRMGPVVTAGPPIDIDAEIDCPVPRGVIRVNDTVVGASERPPTPAVPTSGAGSSSPRSSKATTSSVSSPMATSSASAPTTRPVPAVAPLIMIAAGLAIGAATALFLRRSRPD